MSETKQRSLTGRIIRWGLLAAALLAVFFLARGCLHLADVMNGGYKTQPAFLTGMAIVTADERVVKSLGSPVEETELEAYNAVSSTDGDFKSYRVKLKGPKGTGAVFLRVEDGKPPIVLEAVFIDARGQMTNLLVPP